MDTEELAAWRAWALPETISRVAEQGVLARIEWTWRMRRPAELRDVAAWALGGWFCPGGAVAAASEAAIELAVITALWPEEPRHVLRPSWE